MAVGIELRLTDTASVVRIDYPGIALLLTEFVAVVVVTSATDACAVRASEASSVFVALTVSDNLTGGLSDVLFDDPPETKSVTDSLRIVASESAVVDVGASSTASISASDSLRVAGEDTHSVSSSVVLVIDTAVVQINPSGFGEDVDIFAFIPQQDVSISVVDTCVVQVITIPFNLQSKSASDSCRIVCVEPLDNSQDFDLDDAARVVATEGVPTITLTSQQQDNVAVDSARVVATDTASVVQTTVEQYRVVSELFALATVESLILYTGFEEILASDDAAIACSEASIVAREQEELATETHRIVASDVMQPISVTISVSDGAAVRTSEIVTLLINFSFNVADTCEVRATDSAVLPTTQSILASDTSRVVAAEGGVLIQAAVLASETLRISLNDASLLVLKFVSLTDALGLSLDEAATVFSDFVRLTAADTCAVQGVEAIAFLNQVLTQLITTESLSISATEAAAIFVDAYADALIECGLLDESRLEQQLSTTDSARFVVDSEDANRINPFVVNVFVNVDDHPVVQIDETLNEQPTALGLFVSDSAGLTLDDVGVDENIPLPEVQDFMIETSYRQVNDPQSFETVSSNFW